ncbi:cytochrome P450 4C1-like [Monomorium pharaonis]|uniref:cytochrome P450 4C1-like n=1 Tax=Monomorium pharaonis TaxID=307658 RepID=UPI001746519A|nr:cytochrome P450 4C1-like [Monomorium pharaonis]
MKFCYTHPLKVWFFLIPVVFIRRPDDLEIILGSTKHIEKGKLYDLLQPWFKTGLLVSKGSKWQSRRKILNPTFNFNILQQFAEILIEEGERMTTSLKNTGDTVTKDLIPFIGEHTMNAICETAMGISLKKTDLFYQQYRKAFHQLIEVIRYRFLSPWLHNEWIFSLTSKNREQTKILKILHGFTEKIIAERKIYHKHYEQHKKNLNENSMAVAETIGIKKKRLAMLDLLILASQEGLLTDSDIREEVDVFIAAAYDTTALAVSYTLSLLAEHKDIQDCVRKEVDAIMQESQGKLTVQSLQNLQYLERCIKETLRLYPSAYFILRVTSEETQLNSYLIPAGTMIHLSIYGVHRDPNYWSNPEIFDPDRFLPENIRNRHPYSYIPFSAGPRNCIGQRFAMLEMKAMLAPLIHNFYLEPVDYLKDLRMILDGTLRPINPHRIKFVPIDTKCV